MPNVFRGKSLLSLEKRPEKIRGRILQRDKRQRRMLLSINLAIERMTTGVAISELAERHRLSEEKVRRYIENALLLARSRMFEKNPSKGNRPRGESGDNSTVL